MLRRSLELSGSIASLLQVSSTCADAATAMFDCSPSTTWCSHGFSVTDAQVTTVVNLLNFRLVLAISF